MMNNLDDFLNEVYFNTACDCASAKESHKAMIVAKYIFENYNLVKKKEVNNG